RVRVTARAVARPGLRGLRALGAGLLAGAFGRLTSAVWRRLVALLDVVGVGRRRCYLLALRRRRRGRGVRLRTSPGERRAADRKGRQRDQPRSQLGESCAHVVPPSGWVQVGHAPATVGASGETDVSRGAPGARAAHPFTFLSHCCRHSPRMKVLLVEDDPKLAALVRRALTANGNATDIAPDGE